MKRIVNAFHASRSGFTLIEVLIALAVSGTLGLGAFSVIQTIQSSHRATERIQAVNNLENAIHLISEDVFMSQSVIPGGAAGFPLTLTWQDWDNQTNSVIYSLVDGELQRIYTVGITPPAQKTVARDIDGLHTGCTLSGRVLTLNIAAIIDNISVTRTYELKNRPDGL